LKIVLHNTDVLIAPSLHQVYLFPLYNIQDSTFQ